MSDGYDKKIFARNLMTELKRSGESHGKRIHAQCGFVPQAGGAGRPEVGGSKAGACIQKRRAGIRHSQTLGKGERGADVHR